MKNILLLLLIVVLSLFVIDWFCVRFQPKPSTIRLTMPIKISRAGVFSPARVFICVFHCVKLCHCVKINSKNVSFSSKNVSFNNIVLYSLSA